MGLIISVISPMAPPPRLDSRGSGELAERGGACSFFSFPSSSGSPTVALVASAPHPSPRQLLTLCAFLSGLPNWPNLRNAKKLVH